MTHDQMPTAARKDGVSATVRAEEALRSHTSPQRARVEIMMVAVGALAVSLSQSMLIPVLAVLPERLNTSVGNVEWLLTSTLLVGAIAVPVLGRLGDMFGKRLLLLVALGALTVGSLLTAVTSNVGLLIAGRAIQGASLAAIPLGISLLASLLPRERAGSAVALISAMLGVGGALGLPLAGFVGEHADFHVLFWITAAAGAVTFVGTLAVVPESPARTGGRIDFVGSLLLSSGLVALLLPLAQGSTWGWGSPRTVGLLVLAVVLVGVFGWSQTRVPNPLVDLRALRRPPIVLTNLASVLFGFALFASLIGTASYVEAPVASGYGFGSSIVVGGLCLLPSGVAMLVLAPLAARLIFTIGAHRTLTIGAVIVGLGWVLRIFATASLWEIVLGSTVIGAGTGIAYASMPALIQLHSPAAELAAANGLNSLARSLGSSLASAIGGSILVASTMSLDGFELPTLGAYRVLFAICAAASFLAAVAALFIKPGSTEGV